MDSETRNNLDTTFTLLLLIVYITADPTGEVRLRRLQFGNFVCSPKLSISAFFFIFEDPLKLFPVLSIILTGIV